MQSFVVALALVRLVSSNAVVSVAVVSNAADTENAGNPIRKVVTMLQAMQKKVTAEGAKEKELYDKFMCYCKHGGEDLGLSIASANTKVPQLQSDIEASEAQLVQLKEDLKTHQVDRAAAKEAMAKATAIREKDAKAFAKEKATMDADIGALKSAIKAIEKGMSGGFLQTRSAQVVRKLVTSADIDDPEREEVIAFLDGQHSEGYVPKSGEITGILKTIEEEMSKSLEEATTAEKEAIANYEELVAAKTKEVNALTRAIEQKSTRVGELGVEIVTMKNDLTDTEAALIEDQKFAADMEKNCALKTKDWDERSKTRSEELVALAETIKILNDDDALELFKKTLPSASASASLVQVGGSAAVLRQKALTAIQKAQKSDAKNPDFDFIAMAIKGKKIGFEKVLKMIDDMVAHLKKEQVEDDGKREYCGKQLDVADDKKKGLEQTITDQQTAISEATERLATLKDEIKALEVGVKQLDKSVADSSQQRKEEHAEFTELMASDTAAKELLKFAVNRLQKFYNPKLYNPPPKREVSFVQIAEHNHKKDAPAPPPATYGEFEKKSESSTGVVSMINLLIRDLDKEMTEAETTEEDSQKDYEEAMKDAAEKRAQDSKSLTEKSAANARVETELQDHKEGEVGATRELMATAEYINSLHAECDWLLKYFDVRKEARASEIDSLGQAKAVLSGADFSFLQSKKAFMAKA